MAGKQFSNFGSDNRAELAKSYARRLTDAERGRERLMHDTWVKANKFYEGKAREKVWPWKGASSAVLPVIQTNCNHLKSRLHQAATGMTPVYMMLAILPESTPLFEGFTAGDLRDLWQQWSNHVEQNVLDHDDIMDRVGDLMVKYGDAFVVPDWRNLPMKDLHWNEDVGDYVPEFRDMYDQPVLDVIHGKNVYISVEELDVQKARWVGIDEYWEPEDIEVLRDAGDWNKEEADKILDWHKQKRDESASEAGNWYNLREDGSYIPRDRLDEERREQARLDAHDPSNSKIRLVRVYAREDVDKDRFPEQVEFLIHRESEMIPYIKPLDKWHGERPIIHFHYMRRDGAFYSIGVAEMLFNIQAISNRLVRDQLNNNMVQNTKMFLARANGPIEDQFQAHPGRIIFVDDLEADFKPVDMGTGRPVDIVNVLPLIQSWGERLTGVNDAAMGQMSPKRAPATSTMALLEQANKGTDYIIRGMGKNQRKMWRQCQALYVQYFTDIEAMQRVLGPEKGSLLFQVWKTLTPKDVRDNLAVDAKVATSNLNTQTRRQEAVALFGQTQMAYQTITQTAFALAQVADPALRQLLVFQLQGFNQALGRIYDTFEIKDQKFINPDFLEILQNVQLGSPVPQDAQGTQGPGNQVASAVQLFGEVGAGAGPVAPPGRPQPGVPRNPGETVPGPVEA
jgi:hypothetical protein